LKERRKVIKRGGKTGKQEGILTTFGGKNQKPVEGEEITGEGRTAAGGLVEFQGPCKGVRSGKRGKKGQGGGKNDRFTSSEQKAKTARSPDDRARKGGVRGNPKGGRERSRGGLYRKTAGE